MEEDVRRKETKVEGENKGVRGSIGSRLGKIEGKKWREERERQKTKRRYEGKEGGNSVFCRLESM